MHCSLTHMAPKNLTKRQSSLASFNHSADFDYKRDTKYLCKIMKHCTTAHTLDLDYILHFLSGYNCEQRVILIHDLEFEYEYKLIDMVIERPASPMRSCTLAMLIEPEELYVRDFHDLLVAKQSASTDSDISRTLVEILLALNNEEIGKFKTIYEQLFQSCVQEDLETAIGSNKIILKLLIQFLEAKRYEEPGHSATIAKTIARRLHEAGESTRAIDYDTFIKIFTHDAYSQLSAIFDVYEDKFGQPIQEAIQREFQGPTEIECFQDIVEYTRSPSNYYAKVINQALVKSPIDYTTLIRIIVGHAEKDLLEINLEYSKMFDETLDQTIKNRIDIAEIKRLFLLLVTYGHGTAANEVDQVIFEQHSPNHSPTGSGIIIPSGQLASSGGMRRNRSQEAFDKFVNVFKTIRQH